MVFVFLFYFLFGAKKTLELLSLYGGDINEFYYCEAAEYE